ncbi:MAG: hypothetical protein AB1352_01540 [Patescibacteria group bacterium]
MPPRDNNNSNALMLMRECPSCHSRYTNASVQVLSTSERGSLVSFTCGACQLDILVAVSPMPFGLMGTGMPTDCASGEVLRFMDAREVTEDDAIEVHTLFENSKF